VRERERMARETKSERRGDPVFPSGKRVRGQKPDGMDATQRQRPALVGHATSPVAIQMQSLMVPKPTES
jgi:hypothetical protein